MNDATNLSTILPMIRDRLSQEVEATSLRNVARAVGMSPTGLREFLDGAMPYRPTVEKVLSWWARHAGQQASPNEVRRLGVELATRGLPPHLVGRAATVIHELLSDMSGERLDVVEEAIRRSKG